MQATTGKAPGWRIGSLRGAPVYLGRTWPLIAAVIVVIFGPRVSGVLPGLGYRGYLVALVYAVLLLLSVLAHELCHAIVGQWRGYHVRAILADLWGGHTTYDSEDASPLSSALVSVVGPLSNAALALIAWWALLPQTTGGVPRLLTLAFIWSNAFVAAFNLLPGLPLDGGFLVEALVWALTGSKSLGLLVAGWCGRAVTAALVGWAVVWPLVQGHSPDTVTVLWSVVLAGFLWLGAGNAVARGRSTRLFARVRLSEVLRPVGLAFDGSPVASVRPDVDVAVYDGDRRVWGMARAGDRATIDAQGAASVPLRAVATVQPDGWVCVVPDSHADVTAVVQAAQEAGGGVVAILVLDRAGRPIGQVVVDDLGRALERAQHHID